MLSTAAKIAMCTCTAAMMAGAVVTVPTVKRAVHHATAHGVPHPPRKVAARGSGARRPECPPPALAAFPAAPIVTFAAPIPAEPGGGGGGATGAVTPAVAGIPVAAGLADTPTVNPATPAVPATPTATVPEPATWLLLITGIGGVGAALRRRRRAGGAVTGGALLWASGAADAGGTAASLSAVGATGTSTLAIAGKAMLCVCPAAAVVGGVMAVPPLRAAVHAATAPVPPLAATATPIPCPDGAIPVSGAALKGFPVTVATAPART